MDSGEPACDRPRLANVKGRTARLAGKAGWARKARIKACNVGPMEHCRKWARQGLGKVRRAVGVASCKGERGL